MGLQSDEIVMRIAECSDASSVLKGAETAVMGSQSAETLKGKKREKTGAALPR